MSARRAVWEVARREIVERARSRVLQVSLLLLLLAGVGGAIAAARLTDQTPTDKIGLVGPGSLALAPAIRLEARDAGRRARLNQLPSVPTASRAVRNGRVAAAVIDGSRILVKSSRSTAAVREVRNAIGAMAVVGRLRAAGLSQAQARSALSPPAVRTDVLEPNSRNTPDNRTLVFVGVIALFMMLTFFGQAVAQGVTEEKSSRVVELLLTTVSPRRLLAGKVLGIGALGLCLILVPGAAALGAGTLAGGAGLPAAAPKAIALVVLWFVLGYLLFSVALAAVGAMVSRQEDLSTAEMPILVVAIGGYVLADIVANTSPDGTLAQVTGFVPPFSTMVAPVRMVIGNMDWLALAGAVALDLLATAGLILLAARIYERSILQTGARVRLSHVVLTRAPRPRPATAQTGEIEAVKPAGTEPGGRGSRQPRLSRPADLALRTAGATVLLASAVIGFDKPASIVLVALGVLLIALDFGLKNWPRRPVH